MDRVKQNFEQIKQEIRENISRRYKRITSAINKVFWNSSSDTNHSFYVGSYGRGTAIVTSDIDILIELPQEEYDRYDHYLYNGQSKLLQAVKEAVLNTYPNSTVKADGQIVKVDFADGIKFELLPAFRNWNGKYTYADTNNGGNWKSTNPKAEQEEMRIRNNETNGLLFDTCKHIRKIRDDHFKNEKLSGIVIDSFVYYYIDGWHWRREDEMPSSGETSYEAYLNEKIKWCSLSLKAPGSGDSVDFIESYNGLKKVLEYMAKI